MTWILTNSLWLVGLGLMLASSGIDGAYMARWMPERWAWLGYVLNTTADVGGMVVTYFFGRLRQDRSKVKRRLALFLLFSEVVAVGFSWFFSWRQLLIVMPAVEPLAYHWVAPIAAGFIPLLLGFIGYAESLLAGKFETTTETTERPMRTTERPPVITDKPPTTIDEPAVTNEQPPATTEQPLEITLSEYRSLVAGLNGDRPTTGTEVNQWLTTNGYAEKPVSTANRWAKVKQ